MTKPKQILRLWGVENEFGNVVNVYDYQSDAKQHADEIGGRIVKGVFRPIYKAVPCPKDKLALKPYPSWVCHDCGARAVKHNFRFRESTWHDSMCDVCGRIPVAVTQPRDYGYPTFKGHAQ